jgi:redox-sensitive bicupin YhaK (pirin superfamily)
MIVPRPAETLGVTKLDWIRARHHFRFAGAQNVDLIRWGRLRAVNHNTLAPKAATTPVTHHGTEVIHIVEDGAIDFVQPNGRTIRVGSGEILSTYAGSGLHFSIANARKVDAVYTEIWLICEAPHDPAVVRQLGRNRRHKTHVIAGGRGDLGYFPIACPATLTKHAVPDGQVIEIPIASDKAYAFVLKGGPIFNGTQILPYEGMAIEGEHVLVVVAKGDTEFILIETSE